MSCKEIKVALGLKNIIRFFPKASHLLFFFTFLSMNAQRLLLALITTLLLSLNMACTSKESMPAQKEKSSARYDTTQSMADLMKWVIDPAADTLWDSVSWISNEKGTKSNAPKTEEDWNALRIQAGILVESANLLMLEGRAKDEGIWMEKARLFGIEAKKNLLAIEARDVDKLFELGGDLDHACESCHLKYANYDSMNSSK